MPPSASALLASPVRLPVTLPSTLPVRLPATLPVRLAETVLAEKLPEASRITMRLGVLVLVALLAAATPSEMLAEVWPPTVETTVAPWVPMTSPASRPVKPEDVPLMLPIRLPVMLPPETTRPPLMFAPPLVMVRPAVPVIGAVEFKVMSLLIWASVSEPTVMFAAFRPVRLPPLPLNVAAVTLPDVETLMALLRSVPRMVPSRILAEVMVLLPITVASCVPVTSPLRPPEKLTAFVALATVPVTLAPVRLVKPAPLPLRLPAAIVPLVVMLMAASRSAPAIVPSRILPLVTASLASMAVVMPRLVTLKVLPIKDRPEPAR